MSLSRCIVLIYCCTALWISVWIWNVLLLCLQTVSVTTRGLSARAEFAQEKSRWPKYNCFSLPKKGKFVTQNGSICPWEVVFFSTTWRNNCLIICKPLSFKAPAMWELPRKTPSCVVYFFFFWALNSFVNPDFDTQMVGALYAEVWWPWWKALKSYLMVKDTLAAFILSRA